MEKKELAVAALKNGTVIDHIPSKSLFKVVELLGIKNLSSSVTIGNNLDSEHMGKKGIIKIDGITLDSWHHLGVNEFVEKLPV